MFIVMKHLKIFVFITILLLLFFIIKTSSSHFKNINNIKPLITVLSFRKNSHLWDNLLAKNKKLNYFFHKIPNEKRI